MQRNSDKCAHCEKAFIRLTADVAIVNRLDGETFHASLYSGPNLSSGRTVCTFAYAHDLIGPQNQFVTVTILGLAKDQKKIAKQLEELADKIAALIEGGKKLASTYIFHGGQISPYHRDQWH